MNWKKIKSSISAIVVTAILVLVTNIYQEFDLGDINDRNDVINEAVGMEVHFLDVGQGDSILIIDNDEQISVLIDGGERKYSDEISKMLERKNIQKLDYIIATHPHADHIGGLIGILEKYPVNYVVMPEIEHTSKTYEDFINSILNNEANTNVVYAKNGLYTEQGNFKAKILAPFNNTDDLNNNSVVLKLDYYNYSFLFTGDIEKEVESEILQLGENIDVDFLKVAHHGSSTSNSEDFIKKVSPEISVIQLGVDNDYGHPHDGALSVLEKYSKSIYRTDLNGTVSLYFTDEGYRVGTEK